MSTSIIAPQPPEKQPSIAPIRRKGSLSKLLSFVALDDEVSTKCNDDSAATRELPSFMSTTLLGTRNHRSTSIDLPDASEADADLITVQTVVEDKDLFAEFQSKLKAQAVGTSMSAGAILNQFIKEKNDNILDRRRALASSTSDPSSDATCSKSSGTSTPNQEEEQPFLGLAKAAADTTESAKRIIRRASSRMSAMSLLQSLDTESLFGDDDEEDDGPLILQREQSSESDTGSSSNILANIFTREESLNLQYSSKN